MDKEFKVVIWVGIFFLICFLGEFNTWPREDAIFLVNILFAGYIFAAIIAIIDSLIKRHKKHHLKEDVH